MLVPVSVNLGPGMRNIRTDTVTEPRIENPNYSKLPFLRSMDSEAQLLWIFPDLELRFLWTFIPDQEP